MKALTLLVSMSFLLTGQVGEESHWRHYPGAILVTGAQIWRVNRAEMMTEKEPLLLLNQAQVSRHKEITDNNDLIFKPGSRVKLKPLEQDPKAAADGLAQNPNEANVIKRLTELGVKIPTEGIIFKTKTPLGKVDELVSSLESATAPVRQWNLLGSSLLQPVEGEKVDAQNPKLVPVPDYSVMIELGHRDAIQKVEEPMLVSQSDKPNDVAVSEAAIYNRHFFKVPLRLDVFGSASDESSETEAQVIASADPMYLVRPRNENGGYLIFGTTAERDTGRQIVALQVAKFDVVEAGDFQDISVAIPAECFMKNAIQATVRQQATLKLMDFEDKSTPAGTKKHFSRDGKNSTWMLNMKFKIAKNSSHGGSGVAGEAPPPEQDVASSVRFYLAAADKETEDNGMSYTAIISQVPDAQIPYQDHPVRIFDTACNELQRKVPPTQTAKLPQTRN